MVKQGVTVVDVGTSVINGKLRGMSILMPCPRLLAILRLFQAELVQ